MISPRQFLIPLSIMAVVTVSACERGSASLSKINSTARASDELPPPDASVVGIDAAKEWTVARLASAETNFAEQGRPRFESPTFWGKEIVYSIQVDRFNNGDLENDESVAGETEYASLPGRRHGGDLRGITQRLDYLSDLGITALWLTPIFKHNGSYHGYCATDPTQVDPGFGNPEELRTLVNEAHKRNIKVVLDVVVNHLCDNQSYYEKQPDHRRCSDDLNASNWSGSNAESLAQGSLHMSPGFFPPFKRQEFFNRCGANTHSEMSSEGSEAVYGDFSNGMYDYNTRNRDFQAMFTNLHKWWIAYADVDGFRLDAAKHVSEDYLAYFSTHIRDYAQSLGKKNFYVVGEVAASRDWSTRRVGNMLTDPQNPASHGNIPGALTNAIHDLKSTYLDHLVAPFPGMNAVYDFIYSGDSRGYLLGQTNGGAVRWDLTSPDHSLMAKQADARLSWIVLEIHDWPRFTFQTPNDLWKSKLGLSYLATAQGIPVIYYGMEQGFTGVCGPTMNAGGGNDSIRSLCGGSDDALKRQDMFLNSPWRLGSTVPSINALAYIGPHAPALSRDWKVDPMLGRDHDVYKTSRRFNHLRSSCSPLYQGRTVFRWHEQSNDGLLIFSRIDDGKELVVVVNNTSAALAIPDIDLESDQGSTYRNAVLEGQSAQAGNRRLKFGGTKLDGNSVGVFAPEALLTDYNSTLGARLCK